MELFSMKKELERWV